MSHNENINENEHESFPSFYCFISILVIFALEKELAIRGTAMLKDHFGSQTHIQAPDFYSTFDIKSNLRRTLLNFKWSKSDCDSTSPWQSGPYTKA